MFILAVSENGFGKRTSVDAYRLQSRGGKSVISMKTTPKIGKVSAINLVDGTTEMMLISQFGKISFCHGAFQTKKFRRQRIRYRHLFPTLAVYPPAINLAATFAKDYGIGTLLADSSALTNFQQQTFSDVLLGLNLSGIEWGILRLLAAGLELPVEGLLAATRQPAEVIVPAIRRLVDLSLVLNLGTDLTIAYPLIYAVQGTMGVIPAAEFGVIGRNLKAEFWDKNETLPAYGIVGSTINALLRSDDADLKDFKDFIVPSMLFRSAKDKYEMSGHENWTKAKDLLSRLLELEPDHHGGLILLMKI